MNLNLIRLLCVAISIGAASLSTVLTVKYMFELGQQINSPYLMGSLGLILDITKCSSPMFIGILLFKKKYLATCLTSVIAVTLSLVSFAASVASLEQGVIATKLNSTRFVSLQEQIDAYNVQISDLRVQAESQRSVNQITKATATLSSIPALLSKVEELRDEQSNLSSDSTVAQHGMIVVYIASGALELITWMLISVSHTVFPTDKAKLNKKLAQSDDQIITNHTQTHSNTVDHTQDELYSQTIENKGFHTDTVAQPFAVLTHFATMQVANDNQFETILEENQNTDETEAEHIQNRVTDSKRDEVVYFEIRDAILARQVKPSHRGISSQFKGCSRDLISRVLLDLHEAGFLKPYRKGYAVA
ncbi:hypothetical protein [Vibrio harveyi]